MKRPHGDSSRTPLEGEYQNMNVERRIVPGAGYGAFATRDIAAGTLLTRAIGFHALGMRKMGVFEDMMVQLTSCEEDVRAKAKTLISRCYELCPDEIEESLLKPWEEMTEDFESLKKEYPQLPMEDTFR